MRGVNPLWRLVLNVFSTFMLSFNFLFLVDIGFWRYGVCVCV
jgi:hypothetical protein